jgi:hypothetical protein
MDEFGQPLAHRMLVPQRWRARIEWNSEFGNRVEIRRTESRALQRFFSEIVTASAVTP